MNKLLKRISLTVALLAACGSAVWGATLPYDAAYNNNIGYWLQGAGFKIKFDMTNYGTATSDWHIERTSGSGPTPNHDGNSETVVDGVVYFTFDRADFGNSTYRVYAANTSSSATDDLIVRFENGNTIHLEPNGPSVSATLTPDDGSIAVSWTVQNFSSAIVAQSVEYSTDQTNWSGVAGITPVSTSVTISRLNNGTKYYVRVSANDGTDTYTDTKSATPGVGPSLPVTIDGTHIASDLLYVKISGYPETYPREKTAYKGSTFSGTPTILSIVDAYNVTDSEVVLQLSGTGVSGERVYDIIHKSTDNCARITFENGQTTPSSVSSCSSSSGPTVTLSSTAATSTTVSLSWVYSEVLTIKNITMAIDDEAPIALTKAAGLTWPTSYTVSGLSKGTNHKFQIEVYYDGSGETKDISDIIYVNTLNTSGCDFVSVQKETKDASWSNKCSFTEGHPYTILCKTVSTNPLEMDVTYTKPNNITPVEVWLGVKKNSGDADLKLDAQMTNIGGGVYYRKITSTELSSWGITSVGDSILVGVKNTVPAEAPCTDGMYCTKFVGYALGTGCNEAYYFTFTRRSEEQTTFTLNSSRQIYRFAYRRSGSTGEFTYQTLDNPTNAYTLGIEEFDLGSYEFVVYPVDGDNDIKLLHAVY